MVNEDYEGGEAAEPVEVGCWVDFAWWLGVEEGGRECVDEGSEEAP